MIAFGIILRSFLCYYGVEPPVSCLEENRPISSANYSIIYILLGPFLVLNILNNDLRYQTPAILFMLGGVIWLIILVTRPKTVLTYFGIVFIVGAQLMAILVSRARDKTARSRYVGEVNNVRLSQNLVVEIKEKTAAQAMAAEEEQKRMQFTNMLFHEMRVPLNSVMLSINDLETDDSLKHNLNPDVVENFERVNSGMNAIVSVLNDALDLRRMAEGRYHIEETPFDYHKTINELVHTMESSWNAKRIQFNLSFDDRLDDIPFMLLGDANRLRQVVANYLSNAVKFTPEGGSITLLVRADDLAEDRVDLYTHVQDSGVGIREENQGKLFKPFVQIDPEKLQAGKGSGLGLSIVASIIQSMDGTYGLHSEYGKGSTFWFRVPLKISTVPRQIEEMMTPSQPVETLIDKGKSLHILVTDDDASTRRILTKTMQRFGHTTEEAVDGIDCLDKVKSAQESGNPFDVLFIDQQMPRMDGLETIKLLRARGYKLPIFSLTGSSDNAMIQRLVQAGANRVILKPASRDVIKDVLEGN